MFVPDGVILSFKGKSLSKDEISFFSQIKPFGFILFKRNFSNKKQVKKLINQLKKITINKNVFISVDQEGGRVQRFDNEDFYKYASQGEVAKIFCKKKKETRMLPYSLAYLLGLELKNIGIDINFSPVADIYYEFADKIIGDRAFNSDPYIVKELVLEYCKGLRDSGLFPVPKHFPGHGRSLTDTHKEISIIDNNHKELNKTDFYPFKVLKNEYLVMVAHIIYSNIDSNVATYSKKLISDILRNSFKFKGLVLTDDISMKALKGEFKNKIKQSYYAGCDVILYCGGVLDEMKEIYRYVKPLKKKYFGYFNIGLNQIKKKKLDLENIEKMLLKYRLIKK